MKFSKVLILFLTVSFFAAAAQAQNTGDGLPAKVKNFLESADKFEILMNARSKDGKLIAAMDQKDFKPNYAALINDKNERMTVLNSFYRESNTNEMGAICYLPSHLIRATKASEIVEIEICFGCRKYYGRGSLGEFNGTLSSEIEGAEFIINKIIEQKGTEIK